MEFGQVAQNETQSSVGGRFLSCSVYHLLDQHSISLSPNCIGHRIQVQREGRTLGNMTF